MLGGCGVKVTSAKVVRSKLHGPAHMGHYTQRGGGWKKIARIFFSYTRPPSAGTHRKKKLAPHVGIFFRQEEFFYCVLLGLACHLHFGTLYDIGT